MALESISEFYDIIEYFDMFQGFTEANPYVGARKLRLTRPPVRRAYV